MIYLTEILDSLSDRKSLCCVKPSLDHYIREQVGQDIGRNLTVCLIASDNNNQIKGYEVSLKSIGSMAVIVRPTDENAEKFYLKYGFVKLPDSGKMFLSMKTIAQLFRDSISF